MLTFCCRPLPLAVAERRVASRCGLVISMAMFAHRRVKYSFIPACISSELYLNGTSNKVTTLATAAVFPLLVKNGYTYTEA